MSLVICFVFLVFSMVVFLWMFHFSEGTKWMPRYVYSSFCVKVGKSLFVKWICWAYMYALKMVNFRFDLFGHLVIAHLERLRSRCAQSKNFWSLYICDWMCVMLLVRMASSSAYAMVLQVADDVLK